MNIQTRSFRWPIEQIAEAARLYQTGLSTNECGQHFNPPIHAMTLAYHFQKMGIMRTSAESNRGPRSRYLRSINKTNRRRGDKNHAWKGDQAGEQAGRMRARVLHPLPPTACELCGATTFKRLERHHQDGNTKNNARSNIQWLCSLCHIHEHPKQRGARGRLLPHSKS